MDNNTSPPLSAEVPAILFLGKKCAQLTAQFLCERALWLAHPNWDSGKLYQIAEAMIVLQAELQGVKRAYAELLGQTK